MPDNNPSYLSNLYNLFSTHFNLEEIRTLCFNLNIDYESVAGAESRKPSIIQELLLGLGRNGRLPELIALAQQMRPLTTWPPLPSHFQLPASLLINPTELANLAEKQVISRPPYFMQPYPLQKHFQGRYEERKNLSNWLSQDTEVLYTLVAMGGMGKSALAWVWLLHDVLGKEIPSVTIEKITPNSQFNSSFHGVFWWSFQGAEANFSAFLDNALSYLSGEKGDSQTTPYEKVRSLFSYLQTERILLVLDNFEEVLQANVGEHNPSFEPDADTRFRSCAAAYTANFLQGAASLPLKSRILITTRLFPAELDGLVGCRRENLQPMTLNDAAAFFRAHSIVGTEERIRDVCQSYGHHPLSLRLIAGLIVNDLAKPGDIEAFTHQKSASLKSQQNLLQFSYDALPPKQQILLSRVAAFRATISYAAMLAINPFDSEQLLQKGLAALIERELLQFDRPNRVYSLHPIIRHYAYARLIDKDGVHTKLRNYFAAVPPPTKIEHLEDLSPIIELYHHSLKARLYDDAWDIYNRKLRIPLYYHLSEYEYDLQLLQAMPTNKDGIPPLKLPIWCVWWLLYQTMCYERLGQLSDGMGTVVKAIAWGTQAKEALVVAHAKMPYASLCCDMGQLEKALETIQEGANYLDRYGDKNWQGISHRIHSRVLLMLGRYTEAWEQFEVTQRAYGESSQFTHGRSVLHAHKATWYLWQGQYDAAVQEARSGIELSQQGNYQREFIHASYLLGEALTNQARTSHNMKSSQELLIQAKEHLDTALAQCQRIHLIELEGRVLLTLANWFTTKNDWRQSTVYAQQALDQSTKHQYGLVMADACALLARIAKMQSALNLAQSYLQQAKVHANYDSVYRYHFASMQIDMINALP